MAFRGDHWAHFLLNGLRHNRLGVVAFVGQQMLCAHPLNQCSLMYLAVEPPFVSPMASLPP
jgi:hypothetical protein